ncbi:unnamed protein product [Gongylonema pulchrum]|uniref:FERM domain-containing protein n=1 Tax=Gongylonema pulchrum TaxID=637853 RepID=A0A183EEN4_9BILA|nr:unnamed protein product [Gongylonema pulchrum]
MTTATAAIYEDDDNADPPLSFTADPLRICFQIRCDEHYLDARDGQSTSVFSLKGIIESMREFVLKIS